MSASHFNQNQAFFLILDSYTLSEHRTTKLLPRLKGIVDVISSDPPPPPLYIYLLNLIKD